MENIPTYVRRHHGLETVDYVRDGFPTSAQWLEKILSETYGIPVYQEQIMQIASEVAGFSLGGADLLRRAMGKKDTAEMARQRQIFVEGAGGNGVPKDEANKLFDLLDAFANYGFNKSHSAAYGVITYQTAWLKANYPVEFMAALLTVERRDSDKVAEYASDARKMGVEVLAARHQPLRRGLPGARHADLLRVVRPQGPGRECCRSRSWMSASGPDTSSRWLISARASTTRPATARDSRA